MDTDSLAGRREQAPRDDVRSRVRTFFRNETFYLIILLVVVALGAMQTIRAFGEEAADVGPQPIYLKNIESRTSELLAGGARDRVPAAWLAAMLQVLSQALPVVGTLTILALIVLWIVRRNRAASEVFNPPRWGLWDVLKLAGIGAGASLLFHIIFPLDPARPFYLSADWVAELFARVVVIGAIIHTVVFERGGKLADLGFRGKVARNIGLGIITFFAIQPFIHIVESLESRYVEQIPLPVTVYAIFATKFSGVLFLAPIVAVVITPLAEELFFRSLLQPVLQHRLGRWTGIIAGAAFFAAAHPDVYAMPALFVLGIALGILYDRTRSIVGPVAVHALHNAIVMLSILTTRALIFGIPTT